MKAIAALILASLLSACSVNMVIAPNAVLMIDSANADDNSSQQKFSSENVEVQP